VGSFFVQLAARRGARVVAVCSAVSVEYARALGAAEVIDYTAGDVAGSLRSLASDGVDAVADMVGDREELSRLAEQVRSAGHVASVVGAADIEALEARGIVGANVSGMVATAPLEELAGMLERGEIQAPAITPFPVERAADALAAVGTHHTRGKIVVTMG